MVDPRMKKLADVLVGYSTKVQPGERVLIDAYDIPPEMTAVLVDRVVEAEGLPFVNTHQAIVRRKLILRGTDEQMEISARHALAFMQDMQCYIAVRGGLNITEMADVPGEQIKLHDTHHKPVLDYRVARLQKTGELIRLRAGLYAVRRTWVGRTAPSALKLPL